MFERRRFRLRRALGFLLVGAIATVVAIEVANSDLLLSSKSYEIVGYREDVRRESSDGSIEVVKTKRFDFLPGEERVVFVHDAFGRTVERRPAQCIACPEPIEELPAVETREHL